ncbi:MAG: hypothetical protein ACLFQM_12405 [Fidelibacterota bacterium]
MIKKIVLLSILLLFMACSWFKQETESTPTPLVEINGRTINMDEFIRRAEYTIRPVYCRENYNIHKKIILNSLIAEKLMALELDGDSLVDESNYLTNYLSGRKEQAMREVHYYKNAREKVDISEKEINQVFQRAGRKYKVAFINFPSTEVAQEFMTMLKKENISFLEGAAQLTGKENAPIQEIDYNTVENMAVHNILYKNDVEKEKIYGPIKTDNGDVLIFKVITWTDYKVMSESQITTRYNDVKEKLTNLSAGQLYKGYVGKLMQGKQLDFDRDTFFRLAALYSKLYNIDHEKKRKLINRETWGTDAPFEEIDSLQNQFENLKDASLFKLDGEVWNVARFQKELDRHPLVFRKKNISSQDFPRQFRFAVADLIRDKFITEDAYKKNYDQTEMVQNYTQMWQDNLIADYHRNKYLHERGFTEPFTEDNYINAINTYLNPLIDSLQQKYDQQVKIDTDQFNEIELTRIDLFAIQKNVPYPVVVPGFPLLTTDNKLDYGVKMNR